VTVYDEKDPFVMYWCALNELKGPDYHHFLSLVDGVFFIDRDDKCSPIVGSHLYVRKFYSEFARKMLESEYNFVVTGTPGLNFVLLIYC
jgi:hypothetical protein